MPLSSSFPSATTAMDTNTDPATIAAAMRAAVADGDGTVPVLERFSASTGISMSKVRAT